MTKAIVLALALVGASAHAASQVSMNVFDLKSGKIETKLTVPLWAVKAGLSFSNILDANDKGVDIIKLATDMEARKQIGSFLVIEDHEENQKITFELQ